MEFLGGMVEELFNTGDRVFGKPRLPYLLEPAPIGDTGVCGWEIEDSNNTIIRGSDSVQVLVRVIDAVNTNSHEQFLSEYCCSSMVPCVYDKNNVTVPH